MSSSLIFCFSEVITSGQFGSIIFAIHYSLSLATFFIMVRPDIDSRFSVLTQVDNDFL